MTTPKEEGKRGLVGGMLFDREALLSCACRIGSCRCPGNTIAMTAREMEESISVTFLIWKHVAKSALAGEQKLPVKELSAFYLS